MAKIKVLIADDHTIVRTGLSGLLDSEGSFNVVGTAKNGKEAVELAEKSNPDVIIMDLMMPEMNGIEATSEILKRHPGIRILILTSFGYSSSIADALAAGAAGVILKESENDELVDAVKRVQRGEKVVPESVQSIFINDPPPPELSPRQKEILSSITRGLTKNDIAQQLGISADSVKSHTAKLFAKIGAANRAEAVAIALRKHLLKI